MQGAAPGGRWGAHHAGGLDCEYVAVGWLVGAGAGADVQHGLGVAERGEDARGDPQLGTTRTGVPKADLLVGGIVRLLLGIHAGSPDLDALTVERSA